ncbi:hypothetical protein [Hanstruepera ponticola]|uniref:hypothetical protein n=1 Tax=Hanstruepera ponticola TaxID=2042995 RepID=UPI000CF0A453|nr:hypothetical protein [Hanstruepera ponticola]
MKIILALFLMFGGNFVLSQTYHFDLISIYKTNYNNEIVEQVVLSNSDNQSYFLSLYKKNAYLFDTKNRFRHNFKVKNKKDTKPTLVYKNSFQLSEEPRANYDFKFETIKEDSISKTFKMIPFINNKIIETFYIELTAKKTDKNLFPLYRFSCMHLFETRDDIDLNENIIIVSSKVIGESKREFKLVSLQEYDFIISFD